MPNSYFCQRWVYSQNVAQCAFYLFYFDPKQILNKMRFWIFKINSMKLNFITSLHALHILIKKCFIIYHIPVLYILLKGIKTKSKLNICWKIEFLNSQFSIVKGIKFNNIILRLYSLKNSKKSSLSFLFKNKFIS